LGWKDLNMVKLDKKESWKLEMLLNDILRKLGYNYNFGELKYGGPGQI